MAQEAAHFELIEKAYQYIKDPVNFFAKEEDWMYDGG